MSPQSFDYSDLFKLQKQHFQSVLQQERLYARKERLLKIKKWIKKHPDLIKKALYKDFKKSPQEVAISEIKPVIGEINTALKKLRDWHQPQRVGTPLTLIGTRAKIVKEPKGVTLVIAPWNFPFMLAIGPVISAIAAGNTIVLKPSEMTPHTEKLIQQMIEAIFDKKEVAVITGGIEETQALLELPWNHIFFTGSPQVGKIIMQKAAKHLTSVTLELGGRNAAIITKNTNLRATAKKLAWGKFFNNGQSCVSPNYLLIDAEVKEAFINELKYEFVEMYGNYPKEIKANPAIARVVNHKHFQRICKLVDHTLSADGSIVFGNHRDAEENYLSPTILTIKSTDSPIFQEEIFGPVLPILEYRNLDEALKIINAVEPALALYIFSNSKRTQQKIIRNTSAGTTVINDTTIQFAHPNLPFGGIGMSGMGKAHGYFGFLEFTNQRAVLKQRKKLTTSQLIYPKYNAIKNLIIKYITWYE
ncbi:MAG: aldehyde dehydrogenase family protein [Flavobacteriales bacterium]|jgi:aldehyde dehydrogenase (NAD+)|nr:aldehyde dehydrogenase family protein [Flavobacteriales bacterium]